MSNNIFMPAYWPFFKTNELRRFDYVGENSTIPPFTSVFSYDVGSDSMLYNNYDPSGKWLNKWFYQYKPGFGVSEWRDDYPKGGWPSGRKKVVMDSFLGVPIGWGDIGTIGGYYKNKPKMSPILSNPPQFLTGTQIVIWESALNSFALSNGTVYNDVITVVYQQSWGSKTSGARYWFAKDIGPVAVQWIAPDPNNKGAYITTARMDSKFTIINGTKESITH
jgi:hypothetical protein